MGDGSRYLTREMKKPWDFSEIFVEKFNGRITYRLWWVNPISRIYTEFT